MEETPTAERRQDHGYVRYVREQSLVEAGETFMWVSDDLRQRMVETFKETGIVPKEQVKHYLLAELGVGAGEAFRKGVVEKGKPEEALVHARQVLDALAALEDSSGRHLEGWSAFCARQLKLASKDNLVLWRKLSRVDPATLPEEGL